MIGKIINGKYRIEELIGVGGMAKVYKAVNIQTGELVAIKFLKEENQQNASYVRRFEHEAQAGMNLNHPNIVKLHDAAVFENANYLVFEYINGPTLKDYIVKHGMFAPRAAVNIICHILDAIGYAHEHGIIHRDVKPQNVMITANGTVKLADFGIARLINASTKSFTGLGAMGSVHYISPEQAEGKEITQQTDLYSVGIILYEMLTGTVPFENDNEVAVALMHIKNSVKAPNEVNTNISHALNAVVLKATAKNMKKRYQNAADMKADLIRALEEPDGTFADMPAEADDEESSDDNEDAKVHKTILGLNKGVFILAVSLLASLIVMVGAFMMIRAAYNPTVTVPSLIDLTIEQAESNLGTDLKLVIKRESSDKNPGHIISQDPASGKRLPQGGTVTVIVSIGSENAVSPDLYGQTLPEACQLLQDKGLSVIKVIYDPSAEEEEGTIFDQVPKADEEVKLGTAFTLHISGKPQLIAQMPKVTDMNIKKAVEKLNAAGFTHIIVREENKGAKENNVIEQGYDEGLEIDAESYIFLTVCRTKAGEATYEGACNVTIEPESMGRIIITIVNPDGYETVVYEEIKPAGTLTASFTAHMDNEGEYSCNIYVDMRLFKTMSATFSK